MTAQVHICEPGPVEGMLTRLLASTKDSEFESEYTALAFDQLVELVSFLREVAEDFCV